MQELGAIFDTISSDMGSNVDIGRWPGGWRIDNKGPGMVQLGSVWGVISIPPGHYFEVRGESYTRGKINSP